LLDAIERIQKGRLDPSRPLWEMWFLTGLPGERVGLYVRIHHSVADGMAAMATVASLLDTSPDSTTAPVIPWTPAPPPSSMDLLVDNLTGRLGSLSGAFTAFLHPATSVRRLRSAWPALRSLVAEAPSAETSLDKMVGPERHLTLIRGRLDDAKAVGHANQATVNDILLTVTAGGLRAMLQSRGEAVPGTTLLVYAPVSLRRQRQGPQQGNLIAQMAVPIHLGEADPLRRLRQIAAETTERKARAQISLGALIHGRITRRLMLMAAMRLRVNVATASIPGPSEPLYLLGARLLEVFPILPLIANEPLAVGALSYAGALNIGIVADPDAIPDLDVFTAGVGAELETLGAPPMPAGVVSMTGRQTNNQRSK
jgi:WS/DGAT/MGAT family acyltransferase